VQIEKLKLVAELQLYTVAVRSMQGLLLLQQLSVKVKADYNKLK